METQNKANGTYGGVKGLQKVEMKPVQVAFMLYCLVAAGAFGIEDMIPLSGPGFTLVMLLIPQLQYRANKEEYFKVGSED